ncbi:cache domain-containing protein [Vibrio lamellibrachiae]|uniref:cache domain-containing protein n=1 Tax=Vibrio lamellibrachiae TaxID=2910253 RepID=UPI003D1284C0
MKFLTKRVATYTRFTWQKLVLTFLMSVLMFISATAMTKTESSTGSTNANGTQADSTHVHIMTNDEKRAGQLLNRAVKHVATNGPDGVENFANSEQFTDEELYVFALDVNGTFLVSGGGSAALIGDKVNDTTDMVGKLFFKEMIEKSLADGGGVVEYYWTNPVDSQGEPKRTMFTLVDDIIIAVGYYPSRATSHQARHFLDVAIKALINDEQAALNAFNQTYGNFVDEDLYVFVLDINKGTFLAHGATPELNGKSHKEVTNSDGEHVLTNMLNQAREKGEGELSYRWNNPTTGKTESKHTYYRVYANKLVGVGYYLR